MIRLAHEVTQESANIAANLVALIRKDVAAKRKQTYGPTAEQLSKKLQSDQHSLSVLPQLISESNEHERYKLVDSLIPECYWAIKSDPFASEDSLPRLRVAYRQVFDSLPALKKGRLLEKYARLVREDSDENIEFFNDAFFLSSDIEFLKPQDAAIVTRYLLGRLERADVIINDALVRNISHIGRFISKEELTKLANNIARLVVRRSDPQALELASSIFDNLADAQKSEVEKLGEAWIQLGKKKDYPQAVQQRLEQLGTRWWDIPF